MEAEKGQIDRLRMAIGEQGKEGNDQLARVLQLLAASKALHAAATGASSQVAARSEKD